nr:hypothetical protein GCM10017745_67580 [Saccharothrix mutabilis subsp. capreolus]
MQRDQGQQHQRSDPHERQEARSDRLDVRSQHVHPFTDDCLAALYHRTGKLKPDAGKATLGMGGPSARAARTVASLVQLRLNPGVAGFDVAVAASGRRGG